MLLSLTEEETIQAKSALQLFMNTFSDVCNDLKRLYQMDTFSETSLEIHSILMLTFLSCAVF